MASAEADGIAMIKWEMFLAMAISLRLCLVPITGTP